MNRFEIKGASTGKEFSYAKKELTSFLQKADSLDKKSENKTGNKWEFDLAIDPILRPFSFRVESNEKDGKQVVRLLGNDSTCVLHSVYTVLRSHFSNIRSS
jgi:hypothetical protein